MRVLSHLRQHGISNGGLVAFQLLVREHVIEKSARRNLDRLRVPPSVRDAIKMREPAYRRYLRELEKVGAVRLVETTRGLCAEILIDLEMEHRATHVNMLTGEERQLFW